KIIGYLDTVGLIRDALAQSAKRLPDLFVLFRRHYNERSHETENVLRSADAFRLAVSDEPDLMSDVAGSDLVIGMDSAALEEARLAGRPIIQVIASGYTSDVDFGLLGAPRAHDVDTLTDLMCQG